MRYLSNVVVIILVLVCLSSCVSSGGGGVGESVLEYQRQITYLEGRIALYESSLGGAIDGLEDLTVRAGNIGSTIDELIYLFDEYQRRVNELIRSYRALTGESGSSEVREIDDDNNTVGVDSG